MSITWYQTVKKPTRDLILPSEIHSSLASQLYKSAHASEGRGIITIHQITGSFVLFCFYSQFMQ